MTGHRYDLAIIGAGVTGLGAAMYAGRLNLRTIVVGNAGERSAAQDIGGTITLTDVVENYPGFGVVAAYSAFQDVKSDAVCASDDEEMETQKKAQTQ